MTIRQSKYIAILASPIIGVLWFTIGQLHGDDPTKEFFYIWEIGFPLALIAFFALGFFVGHGIFYSALVVTGIQFLGMSILEGAPDVLPFTVALLVIVFCILFSVGYFGSWIRRRVRGRPSVKAGKSAEE